jgi:hypothetical protein
MSGRHTMCIGFSSKTFRSEKLLSDENFWEADVIAWNIARLEEEFGNASQRGIPDSMLILLDERLRALDTWVRDGHTLIVVLSSLIKGETFGYDLMGVALLSLKFIPASGERD